MQNLDHLNLILKRIIRAKILTILSTLKAKKYQQKLTK